MASPSKIWFLEGLVEVDQLSTLTEAMLRRGFTESEVAAILGGNFCRVYREVLAGPAAE